MVADNIRFSIRGFQLLEALVAFGPTARLPATPETPIYPKTGMANCHDQRCVHPNFDVQTRCGGTLIAQTVIYSPILLLIRGVGLGASVLY